MRTRARAASIAAAIALAVTPTVTAAGTAAGPGAAAPPPTSGDGVSVTLLTGDVVTVRTQADGTERATVRPGPGREHMAFFQQRQGAHLYAVPPHVGRLGPGRLARAPSDAPGRAGAGDA